MSNPLRQQTRKLHIKVTVLCLCVIAVSLALRGTERFSNYVELPAYDQMTKLTWPWKTGHDDICLVTIQNPGIWPLDDATLASILEQLSKAEPAAVSVDLIRDSYRSNRPDGFDSQRLDLALTPDYILFAEGLPGTNSGFQPHPFFKRQGEGIQFSRVGLANFPRDKHFNPPVRRGLISINQRQRLSLPALTALTALSRLHPERSAEFIETLFSRAPLSRTAGGYHMQKDEGEQFLIKYGSNIDVVFADKTFALTDVLNMRTDELRKHFKNKVIYIGTDNANLAKDEIPVIGQPEYRGVKLLALATAQLMRELESGENPIMTTDETSEISSIVVATILACIIALVFASKGILANIFSIIAIPSAVFLIGCLMLSKGVWLPIAAPMTSAGMAGLGTMTLITFHLRKERSAIAELLQKQIGPQVASQVWERNQQLLGDTPNPPETFQGTTLFSDLIGYSSVTDIFQQQQKGDTIIEWINTYLESMVRVVNRHNGFIHKFNADGIFVIFGFPPERDLPEAYHAHQALACAWEMNTEIKKLNDQLSASDKKLPHYYARVGIYSGDMHSGLIGSDERFILDFFGTIINKAARLESIDKQSFVPADDSSAEPVRTLLGKGTVDMIRCSDCISLYQGEPLKIDSRLPSEHVWKLNQKPEFPA